MWECFHCAFNNVDAAVVCAKCRARKPEPGEEPKGRSYYQIQQRAREREADRFMSSRWREAPSNEELQRMWDEITQEPEKIRENLARLEERQYQLRESIKTLVGIIRKPSQKNKEDQLEVILRRLQDW